MKISYVTSNWKSRYCASNKFVLRCCKSESANTFNVRLCKTLGCTCTCLRHTQHISNRFPLYSSFFGITSTLLLLFLLKYKIANWLAFLQHSTMKPTALCSFTPFQQYLWTQSYFPSLTDSRSNVLQTYQWTIELLSISISWWRCRSKETTKMYEKPDMLK